MKTKILILFIASFSTLSTVGISTSYAVGGGDAPGCTNGIPDRCENNFEPDFSCINQKFIDPRTICCNNKCPGESDQIKDPSEQITSIDLFGVRIGLDFSKPDTLPTIVNLLISTVLGLISVYVLFRGIYVAAILRTSATDPAKIESVNKELRNLIIGFILAWASIFIVQLVANVLGLGSLNNLQISGTEGAYVITID